MNPLGRSARTSSAANFTDYWVYVAGPLFGALLAVGAAFVLRGRGGGASRIRSQLREPCGRRSRAPTSDDPRPTNDRRTASKAPRPGVGSAAAPVDTDPQERTARGKDSPSEGSSFEPRGLGSPSGPPGSGRICSRSRRRARVTELVPVRYGRMLASPFAFYRGAAYLHGRGPRLDAAIGAQRQACGDAHVSNFGLFGSPERELLFDINDFDETLPVRGSGT